MKIPQKNRPNWAAVFRTSANFYLAALWFFESDANMAVVSARVWWPLDFGKNLFRANCSARETGGRDTPTHLLRKEVIHPHLPVGIPCSCKFLVFREAWTISSSLNMTFFLDAMIQFSEQNQNMIVLRCRTSNNGGLLYDLDYEVSHFLCQARLKTI